MKASFLLLRAIHDRLPLDANVQLLGVKLASKCTCCYQHALESTTHLFLQSSWALQLWSHYQIIFRNEVDRSSITACIYSWFTRPSSSAVGHLQRLVLFLIFYEIWKARNDANLHFHSPSVIRRINRHCRWIMMDRNPKASTEHENHLLSDFGLQPCASLEPRVTLVRWMLPPHCMFKLNTDGASRGNPGRSGGGDVLSKNEILNNLLG